MEYLATVPSEEFARFWELNPGFVTYARDVSTEAVFLDYLGASDGVSSRPTEAHGLVDCFFHKRFYRGKYDRVPSIELHDDASETYQLLAKMVNSITDEEKPDADIEIAADDHANTRAGKCPMAEPLFFLTFDGAMSKPEGVVGAITSYAAVYTDTENTPILVKKYTGDKSAISLAPMMHAGFWLPAGTLFCVDTKDGQDKDEDWKANPDSWLKIPHLPLHVKTVDVADISGLEPRRFSMWANQDQSQRLTYSMLPRFYERTPLADAYRVDSGVRTRLANFTIENFKAIAESWLEV